MPLGNGMALDPFLGVSDMRHGFLQDSDMGHGNFLKSPGSHDHFLNSTGRHYCFLKSTRNFGTPPVKGPNGEQLQNRKS